LGFLDSLSYKSPTTNFTEIHPGGAMPTHAGLWMNITKAKGAFGYNVIAPKN